MRTLKTLKPGQKGTKDLLARYGASLKTVELVVGRRSPKRAAKCPGSRKLDGHAGGAARRRVALSIGWRERDLQRRVKSAGGRWDPVRRVRMLRRDVAERLELLHRVVGGGA